MFELAPSQLDDLGTANERKNDIGGEAFLNGRLEAERMGGINKDTCMLRGDDGVDD